MRISDGSSDVCSSDLPTGAARRAALAVGFGPLPPMTVERSGFGAGTREIDGRPNATQVVIGTSVAALGTGQPVVLLEANVDDATGETLAHAISALMAAGAHDAWVTPDRKSTRLNSSH